MDEWDRRARRARRAPLFELGDLDPVTMERAEIERVLPHRGRMLLIDGIVGLDASQGRIAGRRQLAGDDPVFADHFPDDPVYPGALLMEMSGQLGLCLPALRDRSSAAEVRPSPVRLVRVREASFCAEARPLDQLTILAEKIEDNGYTFLAIGQVLREETVLSVSLFEAVRGDPDA